MMLGGRFTLFLVGWVVSFGVDASVTGLIQDAETKEALPYANITVLGKYKGTVANAEGRYVLDLEGIAATDTVLFTYMGYQTFKITAARLQEVEIIALQPVAVKLSEVQVLSKVYSAEQIIELVEKNFEKNYSAPPTSQQLFCHKYSLFPVKNGNKVMVKQSDFPGLDKNVFNGLLKKLPNEFIGYQDAIVALYTKGAEHKLVPIKAISLEEGSQQALMKEFEGKLGGFMADFEKTNESKDQYYKIRTGILSHKIGKGETDWDVYKEDSLHYTVQTDLIKSELLFLYHDYTRLESKNWEFITSPHKYLYRLEETTILNDELVYKISFKPKGRGLFQGMLYVSTSTFAILQLDFSFEQGRQTEKIQLFGLGHAMNFKGAHVLFEKGRQGYFVKYLSVHQNESASVDRDFVLVKKQKRLLLDKELNELKLQVDVAFDIQSSWEVLLLDREEIEAQQFDKIEQPSFMKFKKEYVYTPEMWGNHTVLAPTSELAKYRRR